jgi:hypothetical protein
MIALDTTLYKTPVRFYGPETTLATSGIRLRTMPREIKIAEDAAAGWLVLLNGH